MTNTKPNCCPKCAAVEGAFKGLCIFSHCPCHIKPQHEGWEAEFDERLKGKMPNDALMITISRAEWLDHLSMEKSFIRTHIEAAQEDMRRRCLDALPKTEEYKHFFEIGTNTCKYCGEYRILIDRQRVVIRRDEKTGGEVAEVTEKTIDITDFPCPENRHVAWVDGHNTAVRISHAAIEAITPSKD